MDIVIYIYQDSSLVLIIVRSTHLSLSTLTLYTFGVFKSQFNFFSVYAYHFYVYMPIINTGNSLTTVHIFITILHTCDHISMFGYV